MSRFSRGDQDVDAVYDDAPVAQIVITCRRNGAMSVEGCIQNEMYALAMLDNARDAIRSYNAKNAIARGRPVVTPAADTPLASGLYAPGDPVRSLEDRFQ